MKKVQREVWSKLSPIAKKEDKSRISDRQKEALINSAFGSVIRLNYLLDSASISSRNLDAYNWYHALRSVQREVWSKLSPNARTYSNTKLAELAEILYRYQKKKSILEKRDRDVGGMPGNLYNELDAFEKFLRDESDKAGLLIPDKKSFMDMMEEL